MRSPLIRCVRCGRDRQLRGVLPPELHRVLYLCDHLCRDCVDDLCEWWLAMPGAGARATCPTFALLDDLQRDR